MKRIKIHTTRKVRKGALFHYAPFVLHCLFPEVIMNLQEYDEVIRERNVDQTTGFLDKIRSEVLGNKSVELETDEFNKVDAETIELEFYEQYQNKFYFDKFRKFVFNRYNINPTEYIEGYPQVLLIKRYDRIELLDADLKATLNPNPIPVTKDRNGNPCIVQSGDTLYGDSITTPWLATTGKERREIDRVDDVETFMQNKFGDKFKSVYLELIPFEEQVKLFNNAKFIVCAHGGGMANFFFCKPKTEILEVTCGKNGFKLFNIIAEQLNLRHVKCQENRYDHIISLLK